MDIEAIDWWTFDLVREAMVEVTVLWRRSPAAGHAPLRCCWPTDLMVGEQWDYDARGGFDTSSDVVVRALPLSREEVGRRDMVSEWMMLVPAAEDRRLLAVCLEFHARGYTQLPWTKIMRVMGIARGKDGLKKRYRSALRAIAEGLNTAEIRERNVSRGGM